MTTSILTDFINTMVESHREDFEVVEAANQSYEGIQAYIQGLNKDVKAFQRVFQAQEGYFTGFSLGNRIQRKEHLLLGVLFLDRTTFGVKGSVNALATRVRVRPDNPNSAALKNFKISIYFNAPPEVQGKPREYNRWFAENLENILADPKIKSSYIHEFVHVDDFKRLDPKYLLQRAQRKKAERERQDLSGGQKKDFKGYANDPLELNAYFTQAISDVRNLLGKAKTAEEKKAILGGSPQEFVEKFMTSYLKKQVQKNIDPENTKRLMKRASQAWTYLRQRDL